MAAIAREEAALSIEELSFSSAAISIDNANRARAKARVSLSERMVSVAKETTNL